MKSIVVSGSFDDMRSRHVRFLEEAAKLGPLHVLLWPDEAVRQLTGKTPKFTEEERRYFVQAVRYVDRVTLLDEEIYRETIPLSDDIRPLTWAVMEEDDSSEKRSFCAARQIGYHVVPDADLSEVPHPPLEIDEAASSQKKVLVTGCFDWFHSGHVRFFEETSELGELYVVLGHDENVKLLKGEGHPLFPENERRYMVQSIRYVKQALVSSGHGWMDAEPEIALIRPDMYAVNEDGDKPEKQAFCEEHGLEYVVLKRLPKEGLPKRESTALRGF
mgnify:CR=1 FL=1